MLNSATPPAVRRVNKTSLVDEVIAAMRQMLRDATWAAGTKLPSELELSRQLGVGRSTVREALRVLGHLGLVEARSGLGTFVVQKEMQGKFVEVPQTAEVLVELYEFRKAIEIPVSRLAAERRTTTQMKEIRAAWDKCAQAVQRNSALEFAELDHLFHLSIVRAASNRFYTRAYEEIAEAFTGNVKLILGQGQLRSMLHFHDDLIAAIERKDPNLAERAVRENFRETDVRLRLLLES